MQLYLLTEIILIKNEWNAVDVWKQEMDANSRQWEWGMPKNSVFIHKMYIKKTHFEKKKTSTQTKSKEFHENSRNWKDFFVLEWKTAFFSPAARWNEGKQAKSDSGTRFWD